MLLKVLFLINMAFGALPPTDEVSVGDGLENVTGEPRPAECIQNDSFIALNRQTSIGGVLYPAGTEVYFDFEGKAYIFDENDEPVALDVGSSYFDCRQITVVPYDPETGVAGEYNIPLDFELAGRKQKPKKRGGTTYCYRAVKAIVNGNKSYANGRLNLTGAAAYMANPQLQRSGLKRYKDFNSAPAGAICVFGRGGKKTSSGGHKYGHIGIKGRTGVIDPKVGFNLKRPFLGCYR